MRFSLSAIAPVLMLLMAFSAVMPGKILANSDVYDVLPPDTRILQYSLADFDGDNVEELATLYTSDGKTHITLFKGKSGHWFRWWDGDMALELSDGSMPLRLETVDTNGDGRAEILAYYLTGNKGSMTARILTLQDPGSTNPVFEVILEDSTSPPGYPLLGTEGSSSSVTFLRMATEKENGYRRVYCWNGTAFEKCKEVPWEKP